MALFIKSTNTYIFLKNDLEFNLSKISIKALDFFGFLENFFENSPAVECLQPHVYGVRLFAVFYGPKITLRCAQRNKVGMCLVRVGKGCNSGAFEI